MKGLTEADLFEYSRMSAGKYGPQWTAIRKLVSEVRSLRRDLLATKPAGVIHNNDLDAVLVASAELHKAISVLIPKLRPVPVESDEAAVSKAPAPVKAPAQGASTEPPHFLPQDSPKLLLTVPQCAASLGVSRGTAYELVRTGKLPSVHIGRLIRIPRKSIDDYLLGEAPDAP